MLYFWSFYFRLEFSILLKLMPKNSQPSWRLYNWLELVKDVTSGKVQTREGDPNVKLVDRVFEHEMRKAIKESDSAYAKEMVYAIIFSAVLIKSQWAVWSRFFLRLFSSNLLLSIRDLKTPDWSRFFPFRIRSLFLLLNLTNTK